MNGPRVGPFHLLTVGGGLRELLSGTAALPGDWDERLPRPNSLRRASEESKIAVLAAHELLKSSGVSVTERTGIYVGQQQVSLDYCQQFINQSYKDGPRTASPMLFADSVANSIATHLSLTLGFRCSAQTFIGTRVAGIQATLAALEDLEYGAIDQALVVVLGTGTPLTRDGYHAVYSPKLRGRNLPELPVLRGALAFLLRREGEGLPRLLGGALRCDGPRAARQALSGLREAALPKLPPGARALESVFCLVEKRDRPLLREAGIVPAEEAPKLPESFALDPFVRLLLDSARHPDPAGRVVWCLGEEGTAAWLAFDGPLTSSGL